MQHRIHYEPTGDFADLPRTLAEAYEQGAICFQNTSTNKVVLATDTSTNVKFGGVCTGWDRKADAAATGKAAEVRLDIGGAKIWLPIVLVAASTGATVVLASGSSGTLDTVTADAVEILGGAVTYGTSLDATAIVAIAQINANPSNTRFFAYRSASATIKVIERVPTVESFVLASTATTLTTTDTNASAGKNTLTSELGADAYVNDAYSAKFSGTGKMGTFDSFLDENGVRSAAVAGSGHIKITGAVGTVTSTIVTVDGVATANLQTATITWTTSNENTARLLAADINLKINTHGYFARAVGDVVQLFQTNATLSESYGVITTAGTLDLSIQDIYGGSRAYAKVKLRAYGAAVT